MDEPASVPLIHEGESLENATIEAINLSSIHHPDRCRTAIHVQGSIREVSAGESVTVGPTPLSRLVIGGTVDGNDETNTIVLLRIDRMEAPADDPGH